MAAIDKEELGATVLERTKIVRVHVSEDKIYSLLPLKGTFTF